ncbi:MAG: hypothetical protein NC212_10345 [Staphylococcus sp.]|nr:hypothetical protein [Staphylococcus sp.]
MKMTSTIILAAAIILPANAANICDNPSMQLRFSDIPYPEGKLFVAVSSGDSRILMTAVDVESDTVSIPVNLSGFEGKELNVQAFQDLNGNNILDFDSYGRPQEPCLQTNLTPDTRTGELHLKLIQY